ncbi:MAG: type II/IV secretion system ATPase subunit [Candidatus Nanohaloarchaeota archaeon QJJ-9]|nr:type II/IV secretion system ATPase subunit [Candidatus Nanohaloarchaeota archaeon QJJ-9]
MPQFNQKGNANNPAQQSPGDYNFNREEGRARINLRGSTYGASIADFDVVMSRVIDVLAELQDVKEVILAQERDYEYGYDQVKLLNEVASLISRLKRDPQFTQPSEYLQNNCERLAPTVQSFVQDIIAKDLRQDPIGAYVKVKRKISEIKVKIQRSPDRVSECYRHFLENKLQPLEEKIGQLQLIQQVGGNLSGHHIGDRDIYRQIFHPTIRPNFMLTRYMKNVPENTREIDRYDLGDLNTEVQILDKQDEIRPRYHITPPEFSLSDEKYEILDIARRYMSEHKPSKSEFAEPGRTREIFSNIGQDMINNIAQQKNVTLGPDEVDQLSSILTRYTAGLGVLEILLADKKLQDVYVNAPVGSSPIYVIHADHGECRTNLIPTREDAESWATRFRLKSGRPLDEANPVLDTSVRVPGGRARVAVVTKNLSPDGLAYAFRRHRSEPWTFPLFIENDFFTPLAAGLLHFIIDGARSVLYSGTRSAGKTSLLGSSLVELMKKNRIVSVEDTLELPLDRLEELGYNIERLKSASVITQSENEIPAPEAIRTSLRLGDSSLIVGEVRSEEAKALYEAMRVGALANYVAGTIHGEDPYSVFDRVVNDLGVPPTSFKATDVLVTCNRLTSPDGLHKYRRVTQISEVRKEWSDDPLKENAFVPLMKYDAEDDKLKPTDTLRNGESVILNSIASDVKEWKNDWEAVWNNIQLRAKYKRRIANYASESGNRELMESDFVCRANEKFHQISENVSEELGGIDTEEVYQRWNNWFEEQV